MPLPKPRRKTLKRIALLLVLLLVGGCGLAFGKPAYLWTRAWWHDRPVAHELPPGYLDDASRISSVAVAEVWDIPSDPAAAEAQLRDLLMKARERKLPVAIAGARHSMGGHSLRQDGIVVNMVPFNRLKLDAERRVLTAGAGARWSQILPLLDAHGLSVAIMQSNHDFTVGGSLSVNCHGWQVSRPPISSSVRSLRLMKADGAIVTCSRTENAELFSLVLGGYGLFGIILDAELDVVPNVRYRPEIEVVPVEQFGTRLKEKLAAGNIGMAYGRLCVVPGDTFLREAILTTFREEPSAPEQMPKLKAPGFALLRREVYRAQIGSDAGKEMRWRAEKELGDLIGNRRFSRCQLQNEAAAVYQEKNADRTDILHEYFIPVAAAPAFLERIRPIIPHHQGDLLNVTVRHLLPDQDSFLRYAEQEMLAFVMLFSQARTPEADNQMELLTRDLVDAALATGGRYYLPYRLHATPEQFHRAYPQAAAFLAKKREYDPEERFQNQFWVKYGRGR